MSHTCLNFPAAQHYHTLASGNPAKGRRLSWPQKVTIVSNKRARQSNFVALRNVVTIRTAGQTATESFTVTTTLHHSSITRDLSVFSWLRSSRLI